ncbi:MAG: prepilin-type N-terminal cleavage/methylation domain-containing protein [Candidatus Omnitrophota bacterium]
MILRIGKKGFTLIELLVTVAILSLGLVMLYEAFFSYIDAFSYVYRRLDIQRWMEEKLWETEDELVRSGVLMPGETSGAVTIANKGCTWTMSVQTLGELEDSFLYKVDLGVFWQELTRDARLRQVAYVQD